MKYVFVLSIVALVLACGGPAEENKYVAKDPSQKKETKASSNKGVGPFTNVELNDPLVAGMVDAGNGIYEMKCAACHRKSEQRVVGPGFKGVTEKRTPEWIMNMITNVDVMLDEDPSAQKLLEECLTRMPNQNVEPDDARDVLEFLYDNDTKQ